MIPRRRDPFVVSIVVLCALVVAGVATVGFAWRGAAASLVVAIQLPYVVSGAIGGVAVVGFALGLLAIQSTRHAEARERAELRRVATAAADLLAALRPTDRDAQ